MSNRHDRFWEPQEKNTASTFGLCIHTDVYIEFESGSGRDERYRNGDI